MAIFVQRKGQPDTRIPIAVGGGGGASSADQVSYDNEESGLEADNVQEAIDKLNGRIGDGGGSINADIVTEEEWAALPEEKKNSGIYVIVGESNGNESTPTYEIGRDWHVKEIDPPYTSPYSYSAAGLAYGNNKFVLTGTARLDRLAYSEDGVIWTPVNLPDTGDVFSKIIYNGEKFVALNGESAFATHSGDSVMLSTDGINWTRVKMPSSEKWYGIAYGNGKFIATAKDSTKIAYSTDAQTWSSAVLPSGVFLSDVAYGNGRFVAVPQYANGKAVYSTDGINWAASDFSSTLQAYAIAFGNGVFVAVGLNNDLSASPVSEVLHSTDGETWESVRLPFLGSLAHIAFGGGIFVAVDASTARVIYSENGISWNQVKLPPGGSSIWGPITYGDGKFIMLSTNITAVAYSYTGD